MKFGLKRGEERFIVSLKKEDALDSGHAVMKIESISSDGKAPKIEMKNGKMFMDGKEVNIDSLKENGMIIKTKTIKEDKK